MKITAYERIVPYPMQPGVDTGEVAEKLEDSYKIVEVFFEKHADGFEKRFMKEYELELRHGKTNTQAFEQACKGATAWLNKQYGGYMRNDNTGWKTKASRMRGSPSFIDTGNYYRNLKFELRK